MAKRRKTATADAKRWELVRSWLTVLDKADAIRDAIEDLPDELVLNAGRYGLVREYAELLVEAIVSMRPRREQFESTKG